MKVVIVGGVAGGATAAARLRRLDEQAEIIVLERTHYISYANCGLPYYVGGVIADPAKLTLQTPQSFWERFRIDVRVSQEATRILRDEKTLEVKNLETGEVYRESYDKLILSPGAHATLPPVPGVDSPRVFLLRTVEDTFALSEFVSTEQPKRATIVGGGFIGLETAENLCERGIKTTVIQRPAHLMPTLDDDMASLLHNEMRAHGVDVLVKANVVGFETTESSIVTHVEGRSDIEADLVVIAVGVTPESALAREAGLELSQKGSIKVDDRMLTSDEDIYAIGDAVEVTHAISGLPSLIALAGPANKQGRIVADRICGIDSRFTGSQGSSIMKAFDLTIATTGLNEKSARAAGLDFDSVVLSPASHASYYPGAESMTIKALYENPSGRIIGAQIIGGEGVDKRLDVLAVAARAKMTASDLTELDLAYAPPYSSAKDPVNMAGYCIENILTGKLEQVHWSEVESLGANALVLDVRTPGEYEHGHLEGAVNVPLDSLRDSLDEVRSLADQDDGKKRLLVHCQTGLRSYLACRILSQNDIPCANIAGGYRFYEAIYRDRSALMRGVGDCGL